MIERIHMSILREVERQGSLTSAAKALHLTQSALSHSIKKLELQLGIPLWEKNGRNLQFTQAGLHLLKESKRILPQLERADDVMSSYAKGEMGALRIGMECHPCYQWLLGIVNEFLNTYPSVDVDVKQRFQFGGMAALFNHDIDLLVTPDPIQRDNIIFTPVFEYEQVLVVAGSHPFNNKAYLEPHDLNHETLYTYPIPPERLDIYTLFLLPANCMPKKRKAIESTEIILQFVAAQRGVTTLPRWLVEKYQTQFDIQPIRLGEKGIQKHIHLGMRSENDNNSFAKALIKLAIDASAKENLL